MFLSPTNALLYYVHKMLKYTVGDKNISVFKMHGATIKKIISIIFHPTYSSILPYITFQITTQ